MTVKYIGQLGDYSGYGEAARHDVSALLDAGISVTATPLQYTLEIADFGSVFQKVKDTFAKPLDYNIVILHTTPDVYGQHAEQGKYHIGRVFWETDKLPDLFARSIEQFCDEVWTGSEYNALAIKKAGVTKPVYIIPQACEDDLAAEQFLPYTTLTGDTRKFYSIFEWTLRKNPEALLTAYFQEFQHGEAVSLTIKTYIDNHQRSKRTEINTQIAQIKDKLQLASYPPLYLYRNVMDRSQIYRFHQTHDVFVSAHRGEGWGIPQMEAMLMGKPVISTNCGGIHEYLSSEYACLVPYQLMPLSGNNRNQLFYTYDQQWADVDMLQLRKALRDMYLMPQNHVEKMGKSAQRAVKTMFAGEKVGQLMYNRLEEICRNL